LRTAASNVESSTSAISAATRDASGSVPGRRSRSVSASQGSVATQEMT